MAVKLTVPMLTKYFSARLSVALKGEHGVGKTAIVREACKELDLRMKYYSAATLDPWTELTGVPVPNQEDKTLEFFRPHDIDEAEVVFFDEVNRAQDSKTVNALFEIAQFGTINGESLPNLKLVVIAMNPPGGDYDVEELDPAFLDRFDIFLDVKPAIDINYFTKRFGESVAAAAADFWNDHEAARLDPNRSAENEVSYLSPRRMEKIVNAFVKLPSRQTLMGAIPPGFVASADFISKLYDALKSGMREDSTAPGDESGERPSKLMAELNEVLSMPSTRIVTATTAARVSKLLESDVLRQSQNEALLMRLAQSMNQHGTVEQIVGNFPKALERMAPHHWNVLKQGWSNRKVSMLERARARSNS